MYFFYAQFLQKIWIFLIGDSHHFSFEERVFHGLILLGSFNVLILAIQNFLINLILLSVLCIIAFFILFIFYYFSRYKNQVLFIAMGTILFIMRGFFFLNGSPIGASPP